MYGNGNGVFADGRATYRQPLFGNGTLFGKGVPGYSDFSRANSERRLPAEELNKYTVVGNPLERENQNTRIEPTADWLAHAIKQARNQLKQDLDKDGRKVLQKQEVKERLASLEQEQTENFYHDFVNWLSGNGSAEDYKRSGLPEDWAKRDNKFKILSTHPTVVDFLDAKVERQSRYLKELAKMKMRGAGVGQAGPANIDELFKFFKYIVRQQPIDEEDFWHLDENDKKAPNVPEDNTFKLDPNRQIGLDGEPDKLKRSGAYMRRDASEPHGGVGEKPSKKSKAAKSLPVEEQNVPIKKDDAPTSTAEEEAEERKQFNKRLEEHAKKIEADKKEMKEWEERHAREMKEYEERKAKKAAEEELKKREEQDRKIREAAEEVAREIEAKRKAEEGVTLSALKNLAKNSEAPATEAPKQPVVGDAQLAGLVDWDGPAAGEPTPARAVPEPPPATPTIRDISSFVEHDRKWFSPARYRSEPSTPDNNPPPTPASSSATKEQPLNPYKLSRQLELANMVRSLDEQPPKEEATEPANRPYGGPWQGPWSDFKPLPGLPPGHPRQELIQHSLPNEDKVMPSPSAEEKQKWEKSWEEWNKVKWKEQDEPDPVPPVEDEEEKRRLDQLAREQERAIKEGILMSDKIADEAEKQRAAREQRFERSRRELPEEAKKEELERLKQEKERLENDKRAKQEAERRRLEELEKVKKETQDYEDFTDSSIAQNNREKKAKVEAELAAIEQREAEKQAKVTAQRVESALEGVKGLGRGVAQVASKIAGEISSLVKTAGEQAAKSAELNAEALDRALMLKAANERKEARTERERQERARKEKEAARKADNDLWEARQRAERQAQAYAAPPAAAPPAAAAAAATRNRYGVPPPSPSPAAAEAPPPPPTENLSDRIRRGGGGGAAAGPRPDRSAPNVLDKQRIRDAVEVLPNYTRENLGEWTDPRTGEKVKTVKDPRTGLLHRTDSVNERRFNEMTMIGNREGIAKQHEDEDEILEWWRKEMERRPFLKPLEIDTDDNLPKEERELITKHVLDAQYPTYEQLGLDKYDIEAIKAIEPQHTGDRTIEKVREAIRESRLRRKGRRDYVGSFTPEQERGIAFVLAWLKRHASGRQFDTKDTEVEKRARREGVQSQEQLAQLRKRMREEELADASVRDAAGHPQLDSDASRRALKIYHEAYLQNEEEKRQRRARSQRTS